MTPSSTLDQKLMELEERINKLEFVCKGASSQ